MPQPDAPTRALTRTPWAYLCVGWAEHDLLAGEHVRRIAFSTLFLLQLELVPRVLGDPIRPLQAWSGTHTSDPSDSSSNETSTAGDTRGQHGICTGTARGQRAWRAQGTQRVDRSGLPHRSGRGCAILNKRGGGRAAYKKQTSMELKQQPGPLRGWGRGAAP